MFRFDSNHWQASDSLNRVRPLIKEIKSQSTSSLSESFSRLFSIYLGNPDSAGALEEAGNQFAKYKPLEWAGQLEQLVENVSSNSIVFERAAFNRDLRITLNNSFVPYPFDASTFQKEALHLDIRMAYQGFSLPLHEAFYLMLAQALSRSETAVQPTSQFSHLTIDQMYGSMSRNPLLVVLRNHLIALSPGSRGEMKKLVEAVRLYLVNPVLIKYEMDRSRNSSELSRQGSARGSFSTQYHSYSKTVQLRHKIKVHHIHALILLLNYAPEYLTDFPKVCLAYLEYFTQLGGDLACMQALVRAWIFSCSLKGINNIEAQIIRALQRANSKDGWFVLQRESPLSISASEDIGVANVQVAQSILSVMEKQQGWSSSLAYMVTVGNLFRFLKTAKVDYPVFARSRKALISGVNDNSVEEKALRKIFDNVNKGPADIHRKLQKTSQTEFALAIQKINELGGIIEQYMKEFVVSKNPQSKTSGSINGLRFVPISDTQLLQKDDNSNVVPRDGYDQVTSENKKHLISFYRREVYEPWRSPVQSNEWFILFYFFYSIAWVVDLVTPGKRESPWLNLRWLANPINFFGLIALCVVIYLVLE